MKKKRLPTLPVIINIILLIIISYTCAPPGEPQPPGPEAVINLSPGADPYVVKDKPFSLKVVISLTGGGLGAFEFTIAYDSADIELNRSVGNNGVTPGTGGFLSSVDTAEPGILRVTGYDERGIPPAMAIELLEIHWIAVSSGETEIILTVEQLSTPVPQDINTAGSVFHRLNIDEPVYYSLSGRILESIGGSPVAGVTVVLNETNHVTVSNENGFFSLENILIGVYDILATKSGRAGSRMEQVHVNMNRSDVEIIQLLYAFDPGAVIPPSIAVEGIERYGEYSGTLPVDVQVTAGSNPVTATEFHKSIYLKIGMTGMNFFEEVNGSRDTLSYLLNTTFLPAGEANIKVVSYDNNNNRSELNIPVFFADNPGYKPSVAPLEDYYMIIANTYGKSLDLFRNAPSYSRAPADSTIYVEISVLRYYNGVVIYKSNTADGEYELSGQTTYFESGAYKFVDYSPGLEPGTTVYYKLAYFNQHGIGFPTEPIALRILPKYNLHLVSPANNSSVADKTPTLTWTCGIIPDATRVDWITARNILDTTMVAYSFVINETDHTLPELLYNNKYEWDVRSYYEYNNSETEANVLSRSYPGGKGTSDFSSNGAFYFTVLQEPGGED